MLFFHKKVIEEDDFDKFERLVKEVESVKQKLHLARLKLIEKAEENDKNKNVL